MLRKLTAIGLCAALLSACVPDPHYSANSPGRPASGDLEPGAAVPGPTDQPTEGQPLAPTDVRRMTCATLTGATDDDKAYASSFLLGYRSALVNSHTIEIKRIEAVEEAALADCVSKPTALAGQVFAAALQRIGPGGEAVTVPLRPIYHREVPPEAPRLMPATPEQMPPAPEQTPPMQYRPILPPQPPMTPASPITPPPPPPVQPPMTPSSPIAQPTPPPAQPPMTPSSPIGQPMPPPQTPVPPPSPPSMQTPAPPPMTPTPPPNMQPPAPPPNLQPPTPPAPDQPPPPAPTPPAPALSPPPQDPAPAQK
jgi:hypothetical protein